jgi:hypothetical protein
VKRELARLCGTNAEGLRKLVRVSFAKVAEYQRRGVVHLHAVIRLDAASDDCTMPAALYQALTTLPSSTNPFDSALLTTAIQTATAKVSAPFPAGYSDHARWGSQIDVRVITDRARPETTNRPGPAGSNPVSTNATPPNAATTGARAVANYVAKYATKSTDAGGALDRRLHGIEDLDVRGVTGHLRRLVETAWRLGARPDLARLRTWAHTLGFGGHWLTKSRCYSVTFGFLRGERQAWRVDHQPGKMAEPSEVTTMGHWIWAGTGWRTRGDAWLAVLGQKAKAQARLDARDALCLEREPHLEQASCLEGAESLATVSGAGPEAWEQGL